MGIEYVLARHDDKKLFDLGKSGFSLVVGKDWTIPRSEELLWSRIFQFFHGYKSECVTKKEVQDTIDYADKLTARLWTFLKEGTEFSCHSDAGDETLILIAQGYRYVGSRYHVGTPEEQECVKQHNDLHEEIQRDYPMSGYADHHFKRLPFKEPHP